MPEWYWKTESGSLRKKVGTSCLFWLLLLWDYSFLLSPLPFKCFLQDIQVELVYIHVTIQRLLRSQSIKTRDLSSYFIWMASWGSEEGKQLHYWACAQGLFQRACDLSCKSPAVRSIVVQYAGPFLQMALLCWHQHHSQTVTMRN